LVYSRSPGSGDETPRVDGCGPSHLSLAALLAKQAANIDHIAGPGRLSLNVVSSWWADEAKKYGVHFEQHDDRYARTAEWLEVVDQMWKRDHFSFSGSYYQVEDSILQPKPISQPRPVIYAGGESEAAKELISERCDAFVMHGDPPDRIRSKIADMSERREKKGLGPMSFGVAPTRLFVIPKRKRRENWHALPT
jgi:FMNH2-dependent dimethyl sulfone monooxygenase